MLNFMERSPVNAYRICQSVNSGQFSCLLIKYVYSQDPALCSRVKYSNEIELFSAVYTMETKLRIRYGTHNKLEESGGDAGVSD